MSVCCIDWLEVRRKGINEIPLKISKNKGILSIPLSDKGGLLSVIEV